MWTRSDLKSRAKAALKGTFLISVLVFVIYALLTGGDSSNFTLKLGENATKNINVDTGVFGYEYDMDYFTKVISYPMQSLYVLFGTLAVTVSVFWSIFVSAPLTTGLSKYFLVNRRNKEDNNLANLFYPFKSGHYLNIVIVTFLQGIFIFLHFLLLIIPGIIKIFAYSMVPWILADDPSKNYKEVLALSTEMTQGHKMQIFILEVSFTGWYLLTILTLGLAAPLVSTYRQATMAELYETLKGGKENIQYAPGEYF